MWTDHVYTTVHGTKRFLSSFAKWQWRYTLQVKLVQPDYLLIENMTTTPMAAVAREAIEAYGDPQTGRAMEHPVGTGAYVLKDWRRGSKVTLAANPGYREEYFPASKDPQESPAVLGNAGKRLPIIGQVEISIIEESNPRLLPDSPERSTLYRKMSELVGGYAPLVLGFKRHAFMPHPWKYLDIDLARRNAG